MPELKLSKKFKDKLLDNGCYIIWKDCLIDDWDNNLFRYSAIATDKHNTHLQRFIDDDNWKEFIRQSFRWNSTKQGFEYWFVISKIP